MKKVAIFIVLVFAVTWPWGYIARPLLGSANTWTFLTGLLPSVWAPTVIALMLILAAGGTTRVRNELRTRLTIRRDKLWWLVVAIVVPILTSAFAMSVARSAGDGAPFIDLNSALPVVGMQLITGAVGEELGWRGYVLSRAGQTLGPAAASASMGILWAFWHLPAFFTPGMPHQFIPLPLFLIAVASFGIFLGLLFTETQESVLPTMSAHVSLNIMLAIGGLDVTSRSFWLTLAIFNSLIAGAALVRLRRLAPGKR